MNIQRYRVRRKFDNDSKSDKRHSKKLRETRETKSSQDTGLSGKSCTKQKVHSVQYNTDRGYMEACKENRCVKEEECTEITPPLCCFTKLISTRFGNVRNGVTCELGPVLLIERGCSLQEDRKEGREQYETIGEGMKRSSKG